MRQRGPATDLLHFCWWFSFQPPSPEPSLPMGLPTASLSIPQSHVDLASGHSESLASDPAPFSLTPSCLLSCPHTGRAQTKPHTTVSQTCQTLPYFLASAHTIPSTRNVPLNKAILSKCIFHLLHEAFPDQMCPKLRQSHFPMNPHCTE